MAKSAPKHAQRADGPFYLYRVWEVEGVRGHTTENQKKDKNSSNIFVRHSQALDHRGTGEWNKKNKTQQAPVLHIHV